MKTKVAPAGSPEEIQYAAEAAVYLLSGGFPVALPTETVYGLAAWALNHDALFRVFQVKERPLFDPLIVHLPDQGWLDPICDIAEDDRELVARLAHEFWPGPLTIVLPRKSIVPDLVTAGLPTVAVRISAHPVFRNIIEAFGQPLAAPSANRFGRISPTEAAHVVEELDERIHLVVDAGPTQHGIESTIITVRKDSMWIVREGPISAFELRKFGTVGVVARTGSRVAAPGQLQSHYAPKTPLTLLPLGQKVHLDRPEAWGLLAFQDVTGYKGFQELEVLSPQGDMREAARTLFAKLRRLDSLGLKQLVAESVPEQGIGKAIMDRLRKAAGQNE